MSSGGNIKFLPSNAFNQKLISVIVIAVIHAGYLAIFVTEAGVFEAAKLYARLLLLDQRASR
jgi:hypothetical protein